MLSRFFGQLPSALARQSRTVRLDGSIPALLAHPDPDFARPAPVVIWMHGRTVDKRTDNGRYLRWIRAGIAACAIDLPGHGDRLDRAFHHPSRILDVLARAIPEVDRIVEALADPVWNNAFDLSRVAIGGVSLGGMVALRRLCDPHPFVAAAVESTAGNLALLAAPTPGSPQDRVLPFDDATIAPFDPLRHLDGWRPIPLLALHSDADQITDVRCISTFMDALAQRYQAQGIPRDLLTLHTWPQTGAPQEHSGFGRFGAEAKTIQTDFLTRHLLSR